jgi:hypothetical protein
MLVRSERTKFVKMEKVRAAATETILLTSWKNVVEAMDRRPPPTLHNTDGELILMTMDHFAPSSPDALPEIERRLAIEDDVIPPDEEDPGAERVYAFTRAGNKMHKNWDNTIVGRAFVGRDDVRLETNSRERADALRKRFEVLSAGLVTHRAREHVDPLSKAAKKERGERRHERIEEQSPEAAAVLVAFKNEEYRAWLDQELPALGGKTPRQATSHVTLEIVSLNVRKTRSMRPFVQPRARRQDAAAGGQDARAAATGRGHAQGDRAPGEPRARGDALRRTPAQSGSGAVQIKRVRQIRRGRCRAREMTAHVRGAFATRVWQPGPGEGTPGRRGAGCRVDG